MTEQPCVESGVTLVDDESRKYAVLCHLSSLLGFLIPFGNIVAPLIIWFMKRDLSTFVDTHGKESINFQISILIWTLLGVLLCLIFVGFVVLMALLVIDLIVVIRAAIKANEGKSWRYPLTIRFIK